MSDKVICLSDSDDGFNKEEEPAAYREKSSNVDCFPAVGFHYSCQKSKEENSKKNEDCDSEDDIIVKKSKDQLIRENTSSSVENELNRSSDDSEKMFDKPGKLRKRTKATKHKQASKSKASDGGSEKTRAKEQALIEKNLKSIELKKRKNMQPGECLKFIHVTIDEDLNKDGYYSAILDVFEEHNISCQMKPLPVPNSVMWKRIVENHYVNDNNEICTKTVKEDDKQLIVIWNANDIVKAINDKTFVSTIAETTFVIPNKRLTLIICGMEKYFESCKKSNRDHQSQKNHSKNVKTLKISRQDLETNLAEIQLTLGCSSCLIESPQDAAMFVFRFTKAIAEMPLKLEKRRKYLDKIDWYAMGDNKDTVKVDKDGNGLKRLWQQQLCQFTLASLETAEAICSLYPSPQELIKAYSSCSASEGEKLLKDIPIRRAAGPLSTARKIGPELSKKIFIMFTSHNGEETLGNDRE